jgi:hypothetical protein
MKVRATAIATERSNAIGTIELECTPHGLAIVYLGVGAFRDGYAPAALTTGTSVTVPWAAVLAARVEGEHVFLEVEPRVTPHSRLTLASFSTGDYAHGREVARQRLILWLGALGAALVAVMLSALTIPRIAPHAGAGVAAGIGTLSALLILALGFVADRRVAGSGLDGAAAREALAVELSHFLPNLVRLPAPAQPEPKPLALPNLAGLLPRTTAAVVITLTACTLGAVLTAKWMWSRVERPPAPIADVRRPEAPMLEPAAAPLAAAPAAAPEPSSEPAPAASAPAPASDAASLGGKCACLRSDSVLWRKPLPRLSTLLLSKKLIHAPFRKRLELEVAAVNNGDRELRDLSLMVSFFEHDPPPSSKTYAVSHRALYFQGPLAPGQAIKWSVEARGESFQIEHAVTGEIGPGGDGAAPTNLIATLLEANHRPVRLHGAMLLAYLGDPRAREAALKLKEALREDEAPYLDRVLRALGETRACELRISKAGQRRTVEACVFNASNEPRQNLGFQLRGLEGEVRHDDSVSEPPTALLEKSWSIPGELEPGSGVRVRAEIDLDSADPRAFELVADRRDLLP